MKYKTDADLAKYINSLGGSLWLVGGAVRDTIMGKTPHDKDYVITGISIDTLPFERIAGAQFPVFLIEIGGVSCEVAMARSEKKTSVGHKGFEFFTDKSITIEEDLYRRDFTMNAIAINVLSGEVKDPFNGKKDIENKLIRAVSSAFKEDPLRIFRAARFAVQLEFDIDSSTISMIKEVVGSIIELPTERIWAETEKALKCRQARRYFDILKFNGILSMIFPEIEALDVPDRHDSTAYNHTMNLLQCPDDIEMQFGLLVHDFGKGRTDKTKHPSHHGHDKLGIDAVHSFCDRLKISNRLRKVGVLSTEHHMRIKRFQEMKPSTFFKLIDKDLKEDWKLIASLSFVDSAFREGGDIFKESANMLAFVKETMLVESIKKEITGECLLTKGVKSDKFFGDKLFEERVKRLKYYRRLAKVSPEASIKG